METELDLAEYSPDGTMLAVGFHDNNIYIYSSDDYSKLGTIKTHNSFIVSVDWSADSSSWTFKEQNQKSKWSYLHSLFGFVFLSNCNLVDVLINMSILHKLQKKLMTTLEQMLRHAMNVLDSIPKPLFLIVARSSSVSISYSIP